MEIPEAEDYNIHHLELWQHWQRRESSVWGRHGKQVSIKCPHSYREFYNQNLLSGVFLFLKHIQNISSSGFCNRTAMFFHITHKNNPELTCVVAAQRVINLLAPIWRAKYFSKDHSPRCTERPTDAFRAALL